jgi:hypothetical protein
MPGKTENPSKVRAERPRARRYPFVATVELVDLQSDAQLHGRVADLSLYGCGVTCSKTFSAGTKLRLRITHKGCVFSALGRVAYATSEDDMGIVFTRVERNDQVILEKWISQLRQT